MTTATTNMGLLKAAGTDNARDYLKTDLAGSLDDIDAHDHSSGKGVQIPTAGIADDAVTAAKLGANAVETGKIKDGAVTPIKIANRTRKFLAPALSGYFPMEDASLVWGYNSPMIDTPPRLIEGQDGSVLGAFLVPSDYLSDLTVTPVGFAFAGGNILWDGSYTVAGVGEDFNGERVTSGGATKAVVASKVTHFDASSLEATAHDYVIARFTRDGSSVQDTVADSFFLIGWLVSYTADS